ncbi:MAG: VWA domain-containing protein [Deltaproteobacteria bacterium]|nr:VWA domain-containing protein [Deltaproteobacteria bacterium]
MIRLATATSVLLLAFGCGASTGTIGGGDDQGGGGNTGGGGGGGPDASCPAVHFMATQVTPSIQLLIDRSGSMDTNLPNTNTSRYQAMHDALVGANGVVSSLQNKVYFGASLFSADAPCPKLYSQSRAMANASTIKTLIESQAPGGNTPTAPSIDAVVADFAANPPPMGSPPVIVLATDGLPNSCNANDDTTAQTVVAAQHAYSAGIRVFVLGIAGVNDSFLRQVADAGVGMANAPYYTANSPAQLQSAFQQIIGGVVSCDLMISGNIDPNQASGGTVTLNGQTLMYGTDWTLVGGNTIHLQGAACDRLKNSASPTVDASFPCGSVIL